MFNTKVARRYVTTFEKKGLDATARPMVEALAGRGVEGCSVLEIGAGAGTAMIAMLDAGAASVVGIDISAAYEPVARSLFEARGVGEAVDWHTGDFVEIADEVTAADIVFGNRVVCCYPVMEGMVDSATAKAKRFLALAYPRDRWLSRVGAGFINLWMRIRKVPFRTYVHDPAAIAARIEAAGFTQAAAGTTLQWHWFVWEAAAA
jgi:SAM-dependent methyltransferase